MAKSTSLQSLFSLSEVVQKIKSLMNNQKIAADLLWVELFSLVYADSIAYLHANHTTGWVTIISDGLTNQSLNLLSNIQTGLNRLSKPAKPTV